MNTCTTCSKWIRTEPFRIHTRDTLFCSMDCLPDGTLDEPYGLTYASLMEHYIDAVTEPREFESFTERDDLLETIDELAVQCEEYALGEHGIFYKDELRKLHSLFITLHEAVANHFLDVENYIYTDGLHVTWKEMAPPVVNGLESLLQAILDENQWRPFISYNQSLDATTEYRNILVFTENDYMDRLELEELYKAGKQYLQLHENVLGNEIGDVFYFIKMTICPVCSWPEPFEDFSVNEEFQAYVCESCISKKRSEFL